VIAHTSDGLAVIHPDGDSPRQQRDAFAISLLTRRKCSSCDEERDVLMSRIADLYMPIVRYLARQYGGRGEDHDDLLQVAAVGLVKAINGFDPDRTHDFLSYAAPTIRGELKRYFRDSCWAVRPTRRLQQLHVEIVEVSAQLRQQLGTEPTLARVAAAINVSEEEVAEAVIAQNGYSPVSLDVPRDDGHDSLASRLGCEDNEFRHAETHLTLVQATRRLSARDREIVGMRFFRGMTQAQIATEIGTSQVQVSRLLSRIMRDMRSEVDARPRRSGEMPTQRRRVVATPRHAEAS
jgi:RNA polymerase sigma-B factor